MFFNFCYLIRTVAIYPSLDSREKETIRNTFRITGLFWGESIDYGSQLSKFKHKLCQILGNARHCTHPRKCNTWKIIRIIHQVWNTPTGTRNDAGIFDAVQPSDRRYAPRSKYHFKIYIIWKIHEVGSRFGNALTLNYQEHLGNVPRLCTLILRSQRDKHVIITSKRCFIIMCLLRCVFAGMVARWMIRKCPGYRLNVKMSSYHYKDTHHKDKTVSRPSYLYNGNPHTWKDCLYTETGLRLWWLRWSHGLDIILQSKINSTLVNAFAATVH